LNEGNTLTLFALWQDEYHIDNGDVPYDNFETGKRSRLWTWREDERTRFINYAANFQHKFSQPGHELKLGYMYTGGGEDEFFPFGDSSAVRNGNDATLLTVFEYVNAFTLDYVKPMRKGRMEAGSRISLRNIPVTYTLTPGQNSILDFNLGAWSKYKEDVYAFYTNFIRQSAKVDVEAGLRFEPSFINFKLDPANLYYQNTSYKYFPLFPNVRLSFKLNESNTISVFHNRRVDRPGEFDVRPFPKYDDPELLKTGNPNLRPQFTNTYEVAYKKYWNSGSFYTSFFYRDIRNIFSRVYTIGANSPYSIVNTIPANLGRGTNGGVELTFQETITSNWRINASVTVYHNTINAFSGRSYYPYEQTFQSSSSNITTGNFKVNSTWKFPHLYEFQLSSVYYAPDIIPQGKIKSRYSLDFGLKKTSKNKKLEWRLSVTDLLNTFQIRKVISGEGVTVKAYNYYETQVLNVGVKWKF
jgi:outer membrane receptor protein involved in Fe transport